MFKKPISRKPVEKADTQISFRENRFELCNSKAGISAKAREDAGDFILEEGAIGALREAVSFPERIKSVRDDALQTGQITRISKDNFRVEQDISFNSPSAAAVFLFGTSRNGRTDWIVPSSGQSYGAWKDAAIEKELNSGN